MMYEVLCTFMPSTSDEQHMEPSLDQTYLYERCQLIFTASFGQKTIYSLHAKSNIRKGAQSLQRAKAVSMMPAIPLSGLRSKP